MIARPVGHVAFCPGCLLVVVFLVACHGAGPTPRSPRPDTGGTVVSREEILAMGVRTALEALEKANLPLVIQRTRAGSPARIYRRGVSSLLLNPEVQVAVDGVLVPDGIRAMENIPATSVQFIQLLTGREAVVRWGAAAGNGVIHVRTTAS